MKDYSAKIQVASSTEKRPLGSFRMREVNKSKNVNTKAILVPIMVMAFLGAWIGLSIRMGGFLLSEILVCSGIISIIMFIRAAGDINLSEITD